MTTIRYDLDASRSVTWTEQDGFTGHYPLVVVIKAIIDSGFEPGSVAPGFPSPTQGTVEWAGAVIAEAAGLVGVRGHFTCDPELERRPFSQDVIY